MLIVTSKSFHDRVQIDNDEVILNGPPGALTGKIDVSNEQSEKLSVKELPLEHATKSIFSKKADSLRLGVRLQPNEKRQQTITHQVDPYTPPGLYESSILVGGKKKKLKIVVQPHIKIDIYPMSFTFQGTAPRARHTTFITLFNSGNQPFQIPDVKHVTMLDMDYLCRATALAIRSKGAEQSYNAMMDELTRNVFKNMTDALEITIKETGHIIAPGEKKLVEFSLTLPANADPKKDYSGDIRLWDQTISYCIKSYNPGKTQKKKDGTE